MNHRFVRPGFKIFGTGRIPVNRVPGPGNKAGGNKHRLIQ